MVTGSDNPKFAAVAAIIAKADPPEWMVLT